MSEKPPLWAEMLLTVWVLVVAAVTVGGYRQSVLGDWTNQGAALYALMLLASVFVLIWRFLHRETNPGDKEGRR